MMYITWVDDRGCECRVPVLAVFMHLGDKFAVIHYPRGTYSNEEDFRVLRIGEIDGYELTAG